MPTVRVVRPELFVLTGKPGTPTEKPMPDFERFIRAPPPRRMLFRYRIFPMSPSRAPRAAAAAVAPPRLALVPARVLDLRPADARPVPVGRRAVLENDPL